MTRVLRAAAAAILLIAGCAIDEPVVNPSPAPVLAAAETLRNTIKIGTSMDDAKAQAEAQGMLCYWGAPVDVQIAPKSLLLCSRSCDESRFHGWWVALAADNQGRVATIEEAPMRSFAPRSCQTEVRIVGGDGARAALSELASRFAYQSGYKVTLDFVADEEAQRRIEAGEPFDVAIVGPALLDTLVRQGRVAKETRAVIGKSDGGGFVAALARSAKEPEAAQALLRFFTAPAAAEVLKLNGVEPFVE